MIEIRAHNGTRHYVSPAAIASVSETGASSMWHGVRSIVRLFDGTVIESDDTAETMYVRQAPLHVPKPADSTGEVRP